MAETFTGTATQARTLGRNAFLELKFDPGPGGGNVVVSALVRDRDFIELIEDPEPGVPDREVQQASVSVTILAPSGATALMRSVPLRNPHRDSGPIGFTLPAPVEPGSWRCVVRNTGPCEISCTATIVFTRDQRQLERTTIPLRVLNSAFVQVLDAIGLSINIDDGRGVVRMDPEFADLVGLEDPQFTFSTPVGNDISMRSLAVKGLSDFGPALRIFIEFETVGDKEISFVGVDLADITEASIEVTLRLKSVGGFDRRSILPEVHIAAQVGAELTFVGALVDRLLLGGESVQDIANAVTGQVDAAINASDYVQLAGRYLTEAFTQLATRNHRFHALEMQGNAFVVVHYDPKPLSGTGGEIVDTGPGPADPTDSLGPRPRPSAEFIAALDRLRGIDTIVVLMQENRSFDHMLGYRSLPDGNTDGGQPIEGQIDGLTGNERNTTPFDNTTGINRLRTSVFHNSPGHEIDNVKTQVANGDMSGFLTDFTERYPNASVDDGIVNRQTPLSYYDHRLLPVTDRLGDLHLVCDRWFAAFPGATQPNRFCTLTGSTPVLENFPVPHPEIGFLGETTVFDRLTTAGVDWCYYEHDLAFLRFYDSYRLDDRHVIPFQDPRDGFAERARRGTLPPVVFIDPNFVDVPPARTANDDHPPADVALGQDLLAHVHDTLVNSPQWNKSLLVITYDEHGGFFDHVPPPGTRVSPARILPVHPRGPRTLGVRVPTFVVSPFVPAGGVSHVRFDHTSIAWTILLRFVGAEALPMSDRMLQMNHLGMVLDPDLTKETPLIRPEAGTSPTRHPTVRDIPEGGSIPRLLPQEDTSHDFHEAVRRFGRPVMRG